MYGKRLLTLILTFLGAFLGFLVLSFFLYPIFNPIDSDDEIPGDFDLSELQDFNYMEFGPAAIVRLRQEIQDLEEALEQLREKEAQDVAVIDSLFQVNLRLEENLARLGGPGAPGQAQLASAEVELDQRTAEVARSLLRLDENELAPIVNRLSDNQIVDLYRASSNLQREQLLRALEPGKAATLLRNVMS